MNEQMRRDGMRRDGVRRDGMGRGQTDGSTVALLWLALLGVGGWAAWRSWWPKFVDRYDAWAEGGGWERVRVQLVIAGIVLATMVVGGARLVHRARRRRRMVQRLGAVAASVFGPVDPDVQLVRVHRWGKRAQPVELVVEFPVRWSPSVLGRQVLRDELALRSGVRLDAGEWDVVADRVVFRALREAAEVRVDPVEERVEGLLRDAMSTATSVEVTSWTDDHQPAEVTVGYTPSAKVTLERYQHAVTGVVAAALPGRWRSKWETEIDRVTFSLRAVCPIGSCGP